MSGYVLQLAGIDRSHVALVGGKGAHLGELARLPGVRVPAGFCVTTHAFRLVLSQVASLDEHVERLSLLQPGDRDAIRSLSAAIRRAIEDTPIPGDVAAEITRSLHVLGEHHAYAVRSSATAEDSPTASFAGQQDTWLNVIGAPAILEHVRRCWASLFTERAVTYRVRNGIDHRQVHMAVLVQRMVFPQVAGILFTADPITGSRRTATVEASFGLGEALVSGLVNADVYRVRDGGIVERTVGAKQLAIQPAPGGGTRQQAIEPERQARPALTDEQVLRLAQTGHRIAAHFGRPQDVEWCLSDDEFHFVQSRPITTLFPVPDAGDGGNRVYVSVGHQQMMTDAMKPLGLSFWKLTSRAPMHDAGGRLFVDVTGHLASPASRTALLQGLGKSDPLIRDALQAVLDRGDFIRTIADPGAVPPPAGTAPATIGTDPGIVAELIAATRTSIAAAQRDGRTKSGTALLDFIREDLQELRRLLFDPRSYQAIMAGMEAAWWLNERLEEWLGEKSAADTLAQSAPGNVTSEMGLALLEVADAIRPHHEVVAYLELVQDDGFLHELPRFPGGRAASAAIAGWLEQYGMRCVGEIDISRPRWSERPATLLPLLLANVRTFAAGEASRRFERGLLEARQKQDELLARLRALPDGEHRADETKRMIERLRTFVGFREFPKFGMVSRYFIYRQALLGEADRLVQSRVLRDREDIFYLTFEELYDVVRTQQADERVLRERRDAFAWHQSLEPPRVLTSDGEMLNGSYRRDDVPPGALVGLPVSAGRVEGRARVILDLSQADLEPGDILVTACTDPGWTPLFVAVSGLVTEVGGLMTHGAVIAREYGLPAVVGVEHATRLIEDGRRIRVDGAAGYIEFLD